MIRTRLRFRDSQVTEEREGIQKWPRSQTIIVIGIFWNEPGQLALYGAYASRMMKKARPNGVGKSMDRLRVIACIGEPLAPIVWEWCYEVVGRKQAHVLDVSSFTQAISKHTKFSTDVLSDRNRMSCLFTSCRSLAHLARHSGFASVRD